MSFRSMLTFAFLVIFASCGNPHLITKKSSSNQPVSPNGTGNGNTEPGTTTPATGTNSSDNTSLRVLINGTPSRQYDFGVVDSKTPTFVVVKLVNDGSTVLELGDGNWISSPAAFETNTAADLNEALLTNNNSLLCQPKKVLAPNASCSLTVRPLVDQLSESVISTHQWKLNYHSQTGTNNAQDLVEMLTFSATKKSKVQPAIGQLQLAWEYKGLQKVTAAGAPVLQVNAPLWFGESSTLNSIYVSGLVKNQGTMTVRFNSAQVLTGAGSTTVSTSFKLVDPNSCFAVNLVAGQQCQFFLVFNAAQSGTHSGSFEVGFEGQLPAGSTGVVPAGTHAKALEGIKVVASSSTLALSVYDGNEIDFGKINLGSSQTKMIEVQNKSELSSLVQSIEDAFIIDEKTGIINKLPVSELFTFSGGVYPGLAGTCSPNMIFNTPSCMLELKFAPKVLGQVYGRLIVVMGGQPVVLATLKGEGIEALAAGECYEQRDEITYVLGPNFSSGSTDRFAPMRPYLNLPYLESTPVSSVARLSLLHGLDKNYDYCSKGLKGTNCNKTLTTQLMSIKDGMAFVRFSKMSVLPAQDQLIDVKLQFSIGKVDNDGSRYLETELLCVENPSARACSGATFRQKEEPSWFALLNPKFFNATYPVKNVSPIFATELFSGTPNPNGPVKVQKLVVKTKTSTGQPSSTAVYRFNLIKTISITTLMGMDQAQVKTLIENPVAATNPGWAAASFNLILADDTFFDDMPRVLRVVRTKKASCQ